MVAGAGLKKVNAGHAGEFRCLPATDLAKFEHFKSRHEAQVMIKFGTGHFDRHPKVLRNRRRKRKSIYGHGHVRGIG
jgi:hypothetical protein